MESDCAFFVFGIRCEFDYFHSVEQGRGDPLIVVRRCNKNTVGKIHRQFREVVSECLVLLRIQYFEQRRRGISHLARGKFINLIENQDRVHDTCVRQCVDDTSRLRRDIGFSVSAYIGFIADTAERDAGTGAFQRTGNRKCD